MQRAKRLWDDALNDLARDNSRKTKPHEAFKAAPVAPRAAVPKGSVAKLLSTGGPKPPNKCPPPIAPKEEEEEPEDSFTKLLAELQAEEEQKEEAAKKPSRPVKEELPAKARLPAPRNEKTTTQVDTRKRKAEQEVPQVPKSKKKKKRAAKEPEPPSATEEDFEEVLKQFSEKPLEDLFFQGRFHELQTLCRAVRQRRPIPHFHFLSAMLRLQHGKTMEGDLTRCLLEMIEAVEWTSTAAKKYFQYLLLPIMETFVEESQDAILRRMENRPLFGESFSQLVFTKGSRAGELKLDGVLPTEGRPLDDCDSLWLTPLDGQGRAALGDVWPLCEVFVAKLSPLILKCYEENNPAFVAATAGRVMRLDKLAPKTTFARTLVALHCMTEPPRKVKNKKSQKEGVADRLPMNFCPSPTLKKLLMPGASKAELTKWTMEEPKIVTSPHLSATPQPKNLNRSQLSALNSAIDNTLTLIQGPPGTGKTTTCVQILKYWAQNFKPPNKHTRILATSGSNIAVDNLVEGLLKEGIRVVRIGRPESARPELQASAVENVAAKMENVESLSQLDYHNRRAALQKAILSAQVVCCTAVTAGGGLLKDIYFPLVLIDEASQATEPCTLVPICHGCKQLVLCGDHCQLPPTVKSDKVHSEVLKTSLFERLVNAGVEPIMLDKQYRMHPLLSAYPNSAFYDGKLKDARRKQPAKPVEAWPFKEALAVCPIFDAETPKGFSHSNEGEAKKLVKYAQQYLDRGGQEETLGIISPYDSQVKLLRQMLQRCGIRTGLHGVEVNSVDGFQGREKEVIMISTVRSNVENATGFVRDWRRINVAMTRAKSGLLVVCNPLTLARDVQSWRPWLHWTRRRGLWLNDADVQLPDLCWKRRTYDRAKDRHQRYRRRGSPSRSRSPPPKWAFRGE